MLSLIISLPPELTVQMTGNQILLVTEPLITFFLNMSQKYLNIIEFFNSDCLTAFLNQFLLDLYLLILSEISLSTSPTINNSEFFKFKLKKFQ